MSKRVISTWSFAADSINASSPGDLGSLDDPPPNILLQGLLMFAVIALGCTDVVLRQVVAKTLSRFSYMLGLSTAMAYVPVYWIVLVLLLKSGVVPMQQMNWVWNGWRNILGSLRNGIFSEPYLKAFILAASGDSIGNVFGYICTPYVAGPIHSLLAQFTIMFTAMLSMCFLQKRYSMAQVMSLVGVEVAVLIGVIPGLGKKGENSSDPLFSFLLGFSCLFNAMAWVAKELAFGAYARFQKSGSSYKPVEAGSEVQPDTLHIFVVNSHVALFQLPMTLLLVPLAQATGQTHGEDVVSYLREGFGCLAGSLDESPLCAYAARYTAYYVVCNIVWNWTILLNVKFNGALATFVALKAISPCSSVLFAYVDWPLLHTTEVSPVTWIVFIVLIPFILFYMYASYHQQKREQENKATCCYPLGCC